MHVNQRKELRQIDQAIGMRGGRIKIGSTMERAGVEACSMIKKPEQHRTVVRHYTMMGARFGGYALMALGALLTGWRSSLPTGNAELARVAVPLFLTVGVKGVKAFLSTRYANPSVKRGDRPVSWIFVSAGVEAVRSILFLYVRWSNDPVMLAWAEVYAVSSHLTTLWAKTGLLQRALGILKRSAALQRDRLAARSRSNFRSVRTSPSPPTR